MTLRRLALALALCGLCLWAPQTAQLQAAERVSLQVGRFPSEQQALNLLEKLRKKGLKACLLRRDDADGAPEFSVQLGDYATMGQALEAMREKRPQGMACELRVMDEALLKKQLDCSPQNRGAKLEGQRASLHVGRFSSPEDARRLIFELRSQGHSPCLFRRRNDQGELEYTVQLDDYPTVAQALEAMRMYRPEGETCEVRVIDEIELLRNLDCNTIDVVDTNQPPVVEISPAKPYSPAPPDEPEVFYWEENKDELNVLMLAERERDLMTARTLAQNGYTSSAMAWYATLMERFPQDEEIRDYYIDTLIKNEEYARALTLLNMWLEIDPDNVRANRLMAVMYTAMEEYESSFPYWERLHELRPYDLGFVMDHAFARRDHGDWARALELFSQALEGDPDNTLAAEMQQEILKEHRPRYGITTNLFLQAEQGETFTVAQRWGQHLSERAWLEVFYDVMHFQRPRVNPTTAPIEETLHDARVRLTYELGRDWDAIMGGGVYATDRPDYSLEGGLVWQLHEDGQVTGMVEYNRPWTDAIEAPSAEGRRTDIWGLYEGLYDDRWQLSFRGQYTQYNTERYTPYAWGTEFNTILSRRITWRPDLWLSYGFLRRWNVYARQARPLIEDPDNPGAFIPLPDAVFRPVPLTADEETHTISALIEDWFCKYIGYSLTTGINIDTFKDSPAFFVNPNLLWRLGQRADIRLGATYSSDSDLPTGGETLEMYMDMNVTF